MVVVVKIIINIILGIVIAVVIVVVVNCEGPTLSCLILRPAVGIIIVGVDKAKGLIISSVRIFDTAVVITIIIK